MNGAEMFAGIGGFRLGFERAGHRIIWANEIDKYASQIYRAHWNDGTLYEGDIREVNTNTIPNIDFLCAGFPCQSFSVAGKRKGTTEARGTLFAQIVRIAAAKRPNVLLLENVKGLLSSDNGRDFAKVLRALGNLGYILQWQVINSKCFLPQNRERVFIVGHLGEGCFKQVFPIRPDNAKAREVWAKTQQQSSLYRKSGNGENTERNDILSGGEIKVAQALQTDGYLRTGSSFGTNNPQSSRNVRRLTPTECERLQGFPDGWTEGISETQRYKCLGNAVTVPVIEFLGRILD